MKKLSDLKDLDSLRYGIASGYDKPPTKKEKPSKEWEIKRYTLTVFRASKNTFEGLQLRVVYEYKGEERRCPIFARMEEEELKSFCRAFNFGKGVWNHKQLTEKEYYNYSKSIGHAMTRKDVEGLITFAINNDIKQ